MHLLVVLAPPKTPKGRKSIDLPAAPSITRYLLQTTATQLQRNPKVLILVWNRKIQLQQTHLPPSLTFFTIRNDQKAFSPSCLPLYAPNTIIHRDLDVSLIQNIAIERYKLFCNKLASHLIPNAPSLSSRIIPSAPTRRLMRE